MARHVKEAQELARSLLCDAGVDMESPEPVGAALAYFERLVGELDELL